MATYESVDPVAVPAKLPFKRSTVKVVVCNAV